MLEQVTAASGSRANGRLVRHSQLALALLPSVEKVVGLEIEQFLEDFDRPFWEQAGVSDKIETKIGLAVESLKELEAVRTEPCRLGRAPY